MRYCIGLLLVMLCSAAALAGQFQTVSAGINASTCALTTAGTAYCWGVNDAGELGTSTHLDICKPVSLPCAPHPMLVDGGHSFTTIAVGGWHTCGLTPAGEIYCWGYAELGQLGNEAQGVVCPIGGGALCQYVPVIVSGGRHFTALAAGAFHTCALDSDGAAYCWGLDTNGQLGIDTKVGSCEWHQEEVVLARCATAPHAVAGTIRFRSLAAGSDHTCGIAVDSLLYCWGDNQNGELGHSGGGVVNRPLLVRQNLKVIAVAASAAKTCALETTGVVLCWGSFLMPPGVRVDSPTPKPVGDSSRHYTAITVGIEHACALATDGTAYCWGDGRSGELGTGEFRFADTVHVGREVSYEPMRVSGDRTYTSMSAGGDRTCAVGSDALLYCWGSVAFGGMLAGIDEKGKPELVRIP